MRREGTFFWRVGDHGEEQIVEEGGRDPLRRLKEKNESSMDEESGVSTITREPDESSSSGKGSGTEGSEEKGTGKRKGAASEVEREGEAGERAGKKKWRKGGPRRREYKDKGMKRGERGSQEEAPR